MKKLNLLIYFVLITILTSNISTQADIKNSLGNVINKVKPKTKNKDLYFELENKAVKNEDSLKDILEFSTQLKKSGEVNYKGKTYDIWLEKDNKSIGGKERKVVGISIVNKDSLHILEQYFIAYNNDRSIDYFKLSDAKDANKDSWIITDYPVDHGGWASERRFYEDKKKNIQYGGWKQKDADKWIFGAFQPADPKSGSKENWLTWGTKAKYIESPVGLSKKKQEKLYRIAEKRFEEASEVKKLLINIKKKHYVQILQNNNKKYAKNKNNKENENKFVFNDEKYYALIIGNNNYQHLEKLDAAENDAVVIADVLEKKYGFEVDLLLNADYDQTVNSLFKITDKLKRNDNLLIYYAGHGELDKDENRGYWLPVDASYEMRSKWISNQRIVDRIKATKAKHVLLVADSCFSGTLMRSGGNLQKEQSIDEKYIKRLKNKKTRLVITSGGNEPVVDSVGGDHSLFALKFIDTLKNSNTVINSQILFENVRRYVVANADQTPERAMVHKTGHDGGDFLFFPKK